MDNQNKAQISVGVNPIHSFDLQAPHLTSTGIMELRVALCKEFGPRNEMEVNMPYFSRCLPLHSPVMGQMNFNVRGFWVRHASIWRPFYSFKTDSPNIMYGNSSIIESSVPDFDWIDVMLGLINTYGQTGSASHYDLVYQDSNHNDVYVIYSPHLATIVAITEALGYHWHSFDYDDSELLSFMPILGLLRIFLDWYYPSQYAGLTADYVKMYSFLTAITSYTITPGDAVFILDHITEVYYDNDYWCNVWDKPDSPSTGAFSTYSLVDIASNNIKTVTDNNGAVSVEQSLGTVKTTMTPYTYGNMMALASYMKRHQISGARSLDRWLADFGLAIRADKLDRSVYLGSDIKPFKFGDVMSNADTQYAPLGGYAGKGLCASSQDGFKFDVDTKEDFGFLFVLYSVVPSGQTCQGFDRQVKHLSRLSFYDGNFDGKGTQAVAADEVYSSVMGMKSLATVVFGYEQRYAEWKRLLPKMTGNFARYSLQSEFAPWHCVRLLDDASFLGDRNNVKHSLRYLEAFDKDQYFRLFNANKYIEPIEVIFWFDIKLKAPMLPLYEDYVFHDDDAKQKIVVDVNGVKMN